MFIYLHFYIPSDFLKKTVDFSGNLRYNESRKRRAVVSQARRARYRMYFKPDHEIIKQAGRRTPIRRALHKKCSRHCLTQPDNRRPADIIADFRSDCKGIQENKVFSGWIFRPRGENRAAALCMRACGTDFLFERRQRCQHTAATKNGRAASAPDVDFGLLGF